MDMNTAETEVDAVESVSGGHDAQKWILPTVYFENADPDDVDATLVDYRILSNLYIRLQENPHYFIHWHNNDGSNTNLWKESQEFVLDTLENLFRFSKVRRTKKQISKCTFSEYNGLQELIYYYVETFIRISARLQLPKELNKKRFNSRRNSWANGAQLCLHGAKEYVKQSLPQGIFHADFLPAVQYLEKYLHLHILLTKGKIPKDLKSPEDYNGQAEFERMPDKSKSLIYATKATFIGNFRKVSLKSQSEATVVLRQAIKLDPKAYEWHYQFQNWLRFSRRRFRGENYQCPSEEEITTLWETFEECDYTKEIVDPEDETNTKKVETTMRQMARAGLCQGIAELLAFRARKRMNDFPVKFGGLSFASEQEMVDYVYKNTRYVTEAETSQHTFAEWIRTGEILASILPWRYRDFKTAEMCYKKAFAIMPTNSKVNHKLGGLYLVTPEGNGEENMKRALNFLRQSVAFELNNIPAAIDLLKTLLSSPEANKDEIETLMKGLVKFPDLMENDINQLKFVEGCYKFMLGDQLDAVKIWIKHPMEALFPIIQHTSRRHRWNGQLLDCKKVDSALRKYMNNPETTEHDKAVADKLSSSGQNNYNNNRNYPNSNNNYSNRDGNNGSNNQGEGQGIYRNRNGWNSTEGTGARPRQHERKESESDRDSDWRKSSAPLQKYGGSGECGEVVKGNINQSEGGDGAVGEPNGIFAHANHYQPRDKNKKNTDTRRDRSKSPVNWR